MTQRNSKDIRFQAFMRHVDAAIEQVLGGFTHRDLRDFPWRDWFDSGMNYRQAASKALKGSGFTDFTKKDLQLL
jgi:hypothetical protein